MNYKNPCSSLKRLLKQLQTFAMLLTLLDYGITYHFQSFNIIRWSYSNFQFRIKVSDNFAIKFWLIVYFHLVKLSKPKLWHHNVLTERFTITKKPAILWKRIKFLTNSSSCRYHWICQPDVNVNFNFWR